MAQALDKGQGVEALLHRQLPAPVRNPKQTLDGPSETGDKPYIVYMKPLNCMASGEGAGRVSTPLLPFFPPPLR